MNRLLYLFNPEHDMALANFTPYYRPPREILRMGEDLSCLPMWYAEKDGLVKVADMNAAASLGAECSSMGIHPYGQATDTWEDGTVLPWGWDPALVNRLVTEGISTACCPDDESLKRIRFLSGRQRCVRMLEQLTTVAGTCGRAVECLSVPEARDFVEKTGDSLLKSPWSGSGRGLLHISPDGWNENVEGWVARIIRTQGGIMGEPLYHKICDFAMEFYADGRGHIAFAGYSLFETDAHGNYKLNLLLPDIEIERRLAEYISLEILYGVRKCLLVALEELVGGDYTGYLGVDMMVCCENHQYKVHPCVEINLRMNMGVVSRLFFDRYLSMSSSGQYVVEHYAFDGEALRKHHERLVTFPLQLTGDGRILCGCLSLTPVQLTTRYQVYVIVEEKG